MHPLTGDLSSLTTEEINKKIADLSKRLNQAYRMGSYDAIQQIQLFMGDYQYELQIRNSKTMEDAFEKHPELANIINIG